MPSAIRESVASMVRNRSVLRRTLVEYGQDSLGFFIRLPADQGAAWPTDRGEDDDDSPPHVTFLYCGATHPADVPDVIEAAGEVLAAAPPMECFVGGLAWFTNKDGLHVAHSIVECVGLRELNTRLKTVVEGRIVVNQFPGEYTPHCTLRYSSDRSYDGALPQAEFTVAEIEVWYGSERPVAVLPLLGSKD